jgi:heme A synthase
MTAPPPVPATRPRAVQIAFWTSIAGAVLLFVGGMLAITRSYEQLRAAFASSVTDDQVHQALATHRGAGICYVVTGTVLALLAGRTRNGDPRFRRALVALSVVIVVLLAAATVFMRIVLELPAVLAVIPIVVGATLFTRPAAAGWFATPEERADG